MSCHLRGLSFLSAPRTADLHAHSCTSWPGHCHRSSLGDSGEISLWACTHIHTHRETASESQSFVCNHLPLLRDKSTQSTMSKPVAARLRNRSFHCYLTNKIQDQPDTADSVPQRQQNNATHSYATLAASQRVKYYLCPVLHWSTCCQRNSLPWQSSPVTYCENEMHFLLFPGSYRISMKFENNLYMLQVPWIYLLPSRHYKHWQK